MSLCTRSKMSGMRSWFLLSSTAAKIARATGKAKAPHTRLARMQGRGPMRPMCSLIPTILTIAAGLFAAVTPAVAQDYPVRPITIVVPYTPGGSTEIMSRIVGQKLEEKLGKPVLIEMKSGAGTVIGASAVAKAVPDGYTLLMATPT